MSPLVDELPLECQAVINELEKRGKKVKVGNDYNFWVYLWSGLERAGFWLRAFAVTQRLNHVNVNITSVSNLIKPIKAESQSAG